MLPSRCVRCGAGSRDFLCASCIDYLIAYHPLWLNPALLPGPSLLDLVAPDEAPVVSADLRQVEWETPAAEPSATAAVQLIHLLRLPDEGHPTLSVGDAELLHGFLRDARRSTPGDGEVRGALAAMYRYLSTSEWMPPHLATEYRLRANVLEPATTAAPAETRTMEATATKAVDASPHLPESGRAEDEPEPLPELPSMDLEPLAEETSLPPSEPTPPPPEPVPRPEPPLPLPEPFPGPQPEPQPEPEPEEPRVDAAKWTEFESMKHALDLERADMEAWTRSRAADLQAKEASIEERQRRLATMEQDVEAKARAATERLVALEKDEARREVLRFLGTVPGMSESNADVIATAFPDLPSLQSADVKALTQCRGVTDALARAIRLELVPGEVEGEEHANHLREEAQAFLAEGDYDAVVECYDRLLRERPEEIGVWLDRAEILVLLDRPEEA